MNIISPETIFEAIASFMRGYDLYSRDEITKIELIRLCIFPAHFIEDPTYLEVYRTFFSQISQRDVLETLRTCDIYKRDQVLGSLISFAHDFENGKFDGNLHMKCLLMFFNSAHKQGVKYDLCWKVLSLGWGVESSVYKAAYCLLNAGTFDENDYNV